MPPAAGPSGASAIPSPLTSIKSGPFLTCCIARDHPACRDRVGWAIGLPTLASRGDQAIWTAARPVEKVLIWLYCYIVTPAHTLIVTPIKLLRGVASRPVFKQRESSNDRRSSTTSPELKQQPQHSKRSQQGSQANNHCQHITETSRTSSLNLEHGECPGRQPFLKSLLSRCLLISAHTPTSIMAGHYAAAMHRTKENVILPQGRFSPLPLPRSTSTQPINPPCKS